MNKKLTIYLLIILTFITVLACKNDRKDIAVTNVVFNNIKANFQNPESASGVNCWWWWLNGNVNKAAITKDLEAMKSRNFHGAMIFDAGGHNQRGNRDIPTGPLFGSDEWNELFVFALDEAKRLGLEIGFNIQSGWNLGGPRVTPEYTAKQITYSETIISGSKKITQKLELPKTRRDYYKDVAVLAFPLKSSNITNQLINDLDLKLGYSELGGSAPDTRFLLDNTPCNKKNTNNENAEKIRFKN